MRARYELKDFSADTATQIEDAMERSEVVYFERCPVELPSHEDLAFLRDEMAAGLKAKNVSYHPESDSIPRFEAPAEITSRVERILRTHGQRVERFLHRVVPDYVPGWLLGTTSFRPIEERGRDLKPRSMR